VATGIDVNQVVTILERCVAKTIEWASRWGLQFDSTKTEAALFTRRLGDKKLFWAKLTAKIRVGDGFIWFTCEATRWLSIRIDAHLTLKEHHNRCMKKATGTEARLQTLTKTYMVEPESVSTIQVACIQAVAIMVASCGGIATKLADETVSYVSQIDTPDLPYARYSRPLDEHQSETLGLHPRTQSYNPDSSVLRRA